jgi:hypothetical protein
MTDTWASLLSQQRDQRSMAQPIGSSQDTPEGAAAMLMAVQAVQRLHASFDAKFVHPKNLP